VNPFSRLKNRAGAEEADARDDLRRHPIRRPAGVRERDRERREQRRTHRDQHVRAQTRWLVS